jgi:hypothetical protein
MESGDPLMDRSDADAGLPDLAPQGMAARGIVLASLLSAALWIGLAIWISASL